METIIRSAIGLSIEETCGGDAVKYGFTFVVVRVYCPYLSSDVVGSVNDAIGVFINFLAVFSICV